LTKEETNAEVDEAWMPKLSSSSSAAAAAAALVALARRCEVQCTAFFLAERFRFNSFPDFSRFRRHLSLI